MKLFYPLLTLVFISLALSLSAQFSVLLVNDNANGTDRYLEIDTTLNNLGVTYEIYNTVETNIYPDLSILAPHDVVIWYTGNDGVDLKLWDKTNPDDYTFNEPLINYLDNGGIVWLQGLDFFYDILGSAPDYFTPGQFIYDYMGVATYYAQSYADDNNEGLPQLDVVPENGICTLTPVEWVYSTIWYADALEATATAQKIYRMGPQGYVFDAYYSGIYNEYGDSKIFTLAVETARINTESNTDTLFGEVLDYFESISGGDVWVTDITVSGEGGTTTITENGGTLQMLADVQPENATNPTVFWSVANETGMAEINQDGVLQATGTSIGNGTVLVIASAVDGSGVADSIAVTISNQGTDFEILLVNDNDFGTDRYLELDTTLTNLEYAYDIYNTVLTDDYPDSETLSYYDVVIWYTGNDGVDLKLWDVTDTLDYKFNAPLIEYIDNGGHVWLQGLDFFYAILGSAPDEFVAGQFIYDYMGIQSYFAQSYADDGEMGLPQMDIVEGNPMCSVTPVQWTYSTLWYADALWITEDAEGIYRMGPDGYVLDEFYTGVLKHNIAGQVFTLTVETARIDTEANTDLLFSEVLEFWRLTTGVTNNNPTTGNAKLEVAPNPASGHLQVKINAVQATEATVSIYDHLGRTVFLQTVKTPSSGTFELNFEPHAINLIPGIYFVNLQAGGQIQTEKLIIIQ